MVAGLSTLAARVTEGLRRPLPGLGERERESAGEAEPELFETAAYAARSKIILSTSTLQSDALENGGFGPVNDECYAIGYNMTKAGASAMVMSYGRDAPAFVHSLEGAMRDMRDAALVDVD